MNIFDKIEELLSKEYKFEINYFKNFIVLRSIEVDEDGKSRSIIYYFDKVSKLLIKRVVEKGLRCISISLK